MGIQPGFKLVADKGLYYVFKDGVPVHGPTGIDPAEEALDRLQRKARLKPRKCLCCATTFKSEGPHNRLCVNCRSQSIYDGAA